MRIAFLTTYSDEILEYFSITSRINSEYAYEYGYDFIAVRSTMKDRSHHWMKVKALLDNAPNYDYIFFLDADAIVQNPTDLEELIAKYKDYDITVCNDGPNGGLINTGAILFSCNQRGINLLKVWWDNGILYEKQFDKYHEQDVLRFMIERFERRFGHPHEYIKIAPIDEFNSVYGKRDYNTFIYHAMGLPLREKITEFQYYNEQILQEKSRK